jgi:hypothetical protein
MLWFYYFTIPLYWAHVVITFYFTAQLRIFGKVDIEGGGLSQTYRTAQLHFHWGNSSTMGSEHLYNEMAYPLEVSKVITTNPSGAPRLTPVNPGFKWVSCNSTFRFLCSILHIINCHFVIFLRDIVLSVFFDLQLLIIPFEFSNLLLIKIKLPTKWKMTIRRSSISDKEHQWN